MPHSVSGVAVLGQEQYADLFVYHLVSCHTVKENPPVADSQMYCSF